MLLSKQLTHLCLVSHKKNIWKQCRPRLDTATCSIWSGSTLFVIRTGVSIKHGDNKNNPDTVSTGNGPVQKLRQENPLSINGLNFLVWSENLDCLRFSFFPDQYHTISNKACFDVVMSKPHAFIVTFLCLLLFPVGIKAPCKTIPDNIFFFKENKACHFMWVICYADDSHEIPSTIF